jgi:hypothetical protein
MEDDAEALSAKDIVGKGYATLSVCVGVSGLLGFFFSGWRKREIRKKVFILFLFFFFHFVWMGAVVDVGGITSHIKENRRRCVGGRRDIIDTPKKRRKKRL